MGFAQGVSGLNASAANLDVIGNNIANSGTVGFKSGSVLFSDVYAGSRVGLGTQVAGVSRKLHLRRRADQQPWSGCGDCQWRWFFPLGQPGR